jgi:hypothetical protein
MHFGVLLKCSHPRCKGLSRKNRIVSLEGQLYLCAMILGERLVHRGAQYSCHVLLMMKCCLPPPFLLPGATGCERPCIWWRQLKITDCPIQLQEVLEGATSSKPFLVLMIRWSDSMYHLSGEGSPAPWHCGRCPRMPQQADSGEGSLTCH